MASDQWHNELQTSCLTATKEEEEEEEDDGDGYLMVGHYLVVVDGQKERATHKMEAISIAETIYF